MGVLRCSPRETLSLGFLVAGIILAPEFLPSLSLHFFALRPTFIQSLLYSLLTGSPCSKRFFCFVPYNTTKSWRNFSGDGGSLDLTLGRRNIMQSWNIPSEMDCGRREHTRKPIDLQQSYSSSSPSPFSSSSPSTSSYISSFSDSPLKTLFRSDILAGADMQAWHSPSQKWERRLGGRVKAWSPWRRRKNKRII